MGGLPCAAKVIHNYGILAPEARVRGGTGTAPMLQAQALEIATEACCEAFQLAYDDPNLTAADKAAMTYTMQEECDAAVKFAGTLRNWSNHPGPGDQVEQTRAARDSMVGVYVKMIDDLMVKYYPSPAASGTPAP